MDTSTLRYPAVGCEDCTATIPLGRDRTWKEGRCHVLLGTGHKGSTNGVTCARCYQDYTAVVPVEEEFLVTTRQTTTRFQTLEITTHFSVWLHKAGPLLSQSLSTWHTKFWDPMAMVLSNDTNGIRPQNLYVSLQSSLILHLCNLPLFFTSKK